MDICLTFMPYSQIVCLYLYELLEYKISVDKFFTFFVIIMPKTKKDKVSRILNNISSSKNTFTAHAEGVFCNVCSTVLRSVTAWTLDVHMKTPKHIANASRKLSQSQIQTAVSEETSTFAHDLVEAFVIADIPLNKLNDPQLQWLFETYAKQMPPSVTNARTRHLTKIYEKLMSQIQLSLVGKRLWVSQFSLVMFVPRMGLNNSTKNSSINIQKQHSRAL